MPFIIVHGAVANVMGSRFNIKCNYKLDFLPWKLPLTIGGWPDKFQDIVFESSKDSDISNVIVKAVPLDGSWEKKRIFEKVRFCFEEGYVVSISSGVSEIS